MSCPTYAPRSWLLALRFDYVRRQLDLDAEAGPFPEAIRSVVDAVQGMPQITHALDQLTKDGAATVGEGGVASG